MRRYNWHILIPFFVGFLAIGIPVTDCAPKTVQTPAGQAAYTADQVLHVVAALQQSAIDASAKGLIPDQQAVAIVSATVDIEKTLKAVPTGWQTTVRTAWTALKARLTPQASQTLQATLLAVDAALATIGGRP